MSHALTRVEFAAAVRQSFELLAASPLKWLAVTIVFLLVEALSFVPYIGFVAKLAVASLMAAQWLVMCGDVAEGRPPRIATFLGALTRPFSAQAVLVVAGIVPFAAGAIYLMIVGGGWQGAEFFFGHMDKTFAPSAGRFFVFKVVMECVGASFAFVAGAVVLCGLTGVDALLVAWRAAVQNWRLVVLSFAFSTAFEALLAMLSQASPFVGGLVSAILLIGYLAWMIALTYTVSIRALDVALPPAVATPTGGPLDAG